jgi:restriction endonuclease Mrr
MTQAAEVPNEEALRSLPRWALVAFAVRCARRVQPLFTRAWPQAPDEYVATLARAVEETERWAGRGISAMTSARYHANAAAEVADLADQESGAVLKSGAYFAAHAIANAAGCLGHPKEAVTAAHFAARDASVALSPFSGEANDLIATDFHLLKTLARKERWDDNTPVAPDTFSLYSQFDLGALTNGRTIISISMAVNSQLVKYLLEFPERLFQLTPRQFEELIAELFNGFGFQVELTSPTRDNGRDVIAVKCAPAKVKYLIECKRYLPAHKVGLAVVQRLQGVTFGEGANKGIIATTSGFTDPALAALARTPYLLEGRDFSGLVEWLNLYEMLKMSKMIGS